jgi:GNAT superfamily N-acetyltransferase
MTPLPPFRGPFKGPGAARGGDDTPVQPGRLRVTVTYLEMPAPVVRPPVPVPLERLALLRAENCTVPYYRFLYNTVGEPWLWDMRRNMADEVLAKLIGDPGVSIDVAYVAGVPAAFVELERRRAGVANIAYFGVMPPFIGRGIGPWLLDYAIRHAWSLPGIERLTVNTCTFDHPKALPLYQRMGFRPIRRDTRQVPDPRLTGSIPIDAAPHIPLAQPPRSPRLSPKDP